jgi:hypothetical protein
VGYDRYVGKIIRPDTARLRRTGKVIDMTERRREAGRVTAQQSPVEPEPRGAWDFPTLAARIRARSSSEPTTPSAD